jgi:hypothetical protein
MSAVKPLYVHHCFLPLQPFNACSDRRAVSQPRKVGQNSSQRVFPWAQSKREVSWRMLDESGSHRLAVVTVSALERTARCRVGDQLHALAAVPRFGPVCA